MADTDTVQKTITKQKVRAPDMYKVILLNDNVTPFDFVIQVLMAIFNKDEKVALEITRSVHEIGHGIAGIYTYEIASQKHLEVRAIADANGFPLQTVVEPE